LGIEPERKVLLLFGMIDRRKGIYPVLEALQQLLPTEQAQLALLLVGPLAEADRVAVTTAIATLHQASSLQIVLRDQFIVDDAIQSYFAPADLVLALYQRHVGMSAILVRAAAAGKPVLASDYGLMGRIVAEHRLGLTVDSTQPYQIVEGLQAFLRNGQGAIFDEQTMAKFAQQNSAQHFAETIGRAVCGL
jgi:glycosyltransferase involved in cell wall biosynthesis